MFCLPAKALSFKPEYEGLMAFKENHPEMEVELPASATTVKQEKNRTIWIKEGNTLKEKHVELGETNETYYEVLSGVKEGDEVVVINEFCIGCPC